MEPACLPSPRPGPADAPAVPATGSNQPCLSPPVPAWCPGPRRGRAGSQPWLEHLQGPTWPWTPVRVTGLPGPFGGPNTVPDLRRGQAPVKSSQMVPAPSCCLQGARPGPQLRPTSWAPPIAGEEFASSFFLSFSILKDSHIYLFIYFKGKERERGQRERERECQVDGTPDMRLGPTMLRSRPEPRPRVGCPTN